MTSHGQRRPVTSRDFNRLLFALILLATLAVLARLVTRQESRAAGTEAGEISAAEWVRTADALFLRGEWEMAADAYLGAVETAVAHGIRLEVHVYRKLAESLRESGERRSAVYFMKLYRARLQEIAKHPLLVDYAAAEDGLQGKDIEAELADADAILAAWSRTR